MNCNIFMSSTKSNFFMNFFYKTFPIYIKFSKDSSAKYYQNNKKILQKDLVKDIKVFLKKKGKKAATSL